MKFFYRCLSPPIINDFSLERHLETQGAPTSSVDHFFLQCQVAKELWDTVLYLFGVHWVMPQQVKELIEGCHGGLSKSRFGMLSLISSCGVYRERNFRTFEDSETTTTNLKLKFFRLLFEWMQATNLSSFASFQDFLNSCNS